MAKLEKLFREEIARLARREYKQQAEAVNSRMLCFKRSVSEQKKQIEDLKERLVLLEKRLAVAGVPEPISALVSRERVKNSRVSPRLIKSQRKRLKLNQSNFARLLGVSLPTVRAWEQGRSAPKGGNLAAFVAVREVKPPEAYARLGLEPPSRRRARSGKIAGRARPGGSGDAAADRPAPGPEPGA